MRLRKKGERDGFHISAEPRANETKQGGNCATGSKADVESRNGRLRSAARGRPAAREAKCHADRGDDMPKTREIQNEKQARESTTSEKGKK